MFSRRIPTEDEKQRFGRLIHEARKSQNLTQEKIAERMNCSLRWINRVERGESSLNWRDTLCLLVILELSPEEVAREIGLNVSIFAHRK